MRNIFFLFIIFGCSNSSDVSTGQSIAYHLQWAESIVEEYPSRSEDGFVRGSPGSWITLMEVNVIASVRDVYQLCLMYKIPYQTQKNGHLKLAFKQRQNCKDHYYLDDALSIENIEQLWMRKRSVNCDRQISVLRGKIKKNICLNFLNLNEEQPLYEDEIGASSAKLRSFSGVVILPFVDQKQGYEQKQYLRPSLEGDFQGDLEPYVCHRVSSSCEEQMPFECDQCQHGWTEVIDSNCRERSSKYCAVDRCGEKGHPACLRGWQHPAADQRDYCESETLAFCQHDLVPTCKQGNLLCL